MLRDTLTLSNIKNSDFYSSDVLKKIVLHYLKEYDCMLAQDRATAHNSRKTI